MRTGGPGGCPFSRTKTMAVLREFQVSKQDLRIVRIVQAQPAPLASGNARLKLDLFSLTANNITYAAMGAGTLGYWDFFPGTDDWGLPPCWGFGTVVQSTADGVDVGARYYGFFPIADVLDVTPQRAGPRGFVDGAPHRSTKSAVYNQYVNVATDPAYEGSFEAEQVLFRPLYATGWWAADCVTAGAPDAVVVSSASSKTVHGASAAPKGRHRADGDHLCTERSVRPGNGALRPDAHVRCRRHAHGAH
jgi:Protein of unknown function (DUF2855)